MLRTVSLVILISLLNCGASLAQSNDQDSRLCAHTDKPESAIPACTRLLNSSETSDKEVIYYNRGRAYASTQNYERAIVDFTRSIQLRPDQAGAYINRGLAYRERGEFQPAIVDLTEAVALKPDEWSNYLIRGFTYFKVGMFQEAINDYAEVLRLQPGNDSAYAYRGWAHVAQGKIEPALSDAKKSQEINSRNKIAVTVKAMALSKSGDLNGAIEEYNRAIDIDPSFWTAYSRRGAIYRDLGKLDLALQDLTTAIENDPRYTPAYTERGLTYEKAKQPEKALDDYRKAISLNPGLQQEDLNAQKLALERLNELTPTNTPIAHRMPVQAGRVALLIGNKAYSDTVGHLENPIKDIESISASLRKIGFSENDIIMVSDANFRDMQVAINKYLSRLRDAGQDGVGLFYYSGHGAANPNDQSNYLIPVDVKDAESDSLWQESISLTDILDRISKQAPEAAKFIVLDACRNNLKLRPKRALGNTKGFVAVGGNPPGLLVSYSTALNKSAEDDGAYAKILSEEIVKPGAESINVFRKVQNRVYKAIGQEPYIVLSPGRDVYFAGQQIN